MTLASCHRASAGGGTTAEARSRVMDSKTRAATRGLRPRRRRRERLLQSRCKLTAFLSFESRVFVEQCAQPRMVPLRQVSRDDPVALRSSAELEHGAGKQGRVSFPTHGESRSSPRSRVRRRWHACREPDAADGPLAARARADLPSRQPRSRRRRPERRCLRSGTRELISAFSSPRRKASSTRSRSARAMSQVMVHDQPFASDRVGGVVVCGEYEDG